MHKVDQLRSLALNYDEQVAYKLLGIQPPHPDI